MTNYCFHAHDNTAYDSVPQYYIIISNFSGANKIGSCYKTSFIGNVVSCSTLSNFCWETYFSARLYVSSKQHFISKIDITFPKFMGRIMRKSESWKNVELLLDFTNSWNVIYSDLFETYSADIENYISLTFKTRDAEIIL